MTGVWRYMLGGTVKHRLPGVDAAVARCGMRPWGTPWLDGPLLGRLPECRNCARIDRLADAHVCVPVVEAAIRVQEEQDAADPVATTERAQRWEAGQQRIAGRMRRLRGDLL